jgi:hypothetical protein
MHEIFDRDLYATTTSQSMLLAPAARNGFFSNMYEKVDTVIISTAIDLVPGVVDFKFSYTYSHGSEDWSIQNSPYTPAGLLPLAGLCPGAGATAACAPFPTTKTNFQRIDATLRHTVDPQLVAKLGWTGEVFLKLRYAWDHNNVSNWQQELMSPYLYLTDATYARMIEMGGTNPNYDAHRLQMSLAAKW